MKKVLTIGITGHRDIIVNDELKENIRNFLIPFCYQYKTIKLLSPLADGADRLVAEIFLEFKKNFRGLELIVPMPFNKERYLEDFDTASQKEFLNHLNSASEIFEVKGEQEENYRVLGLYVVNHSDILLALWDGTFNEKSGGTGDIVTYAKEQKREIVHFLSERTSSIF